MTNFPAYIRLSKFGNFQLQGCVRSQSHKGVSAEEALTEGVYGMPSDKTNRTSLFKMMYRISPQEEGLEDKQDPVAKR